MFKVKDMHKQKSELNSGNQANTNGVALKAGTWYVFSSVMIKAVSTISTPIFTRIMSTEDFGRVSTFFSWAALIMVFCTVNLSYSIGRAKQDYPDKFDEYICSVQIISLGISMIIATILLICNKNFSRFMEISSIGMICLAIYIISMPIIQFYQIGCRYRYRYKENIFISLFISLFSIIVSIFLIIFFPGDKADYRIIGSVTPIVLLAICLLVKYAKNKSIVFNKEYAHYGIVLSTPLVLHEFAHYILAQSDRLFIIKLCGAADTGVYSVAYSYGCLMLIITNAISDGWLPWFHDKYFEKRYDDIRGNVKWVVILGCYIGLACVALAPEAIAFLGGVQYRKGMYCIAPVTMGIVCQYVYTHYVNIEMHLKKTQFVPIGTMIAAVVNFILNAIFIPIYGYIAASYTTFVSYFVLMIVHYIYSKYVLNVRLYNDIFMFGSVGVTAIAMLLLVFSYNINIVRIIYIVIGMTSFVLVFRRWKKTCKL